MRASILIVIFAVLAFSYIPQAQSSGIGCDACKFVVTWIEAKLADNATESEIVTDLDKLCADLPSSLSGTCQTIANNYVPQIISYLENNESPAVACAQIKLCSLAAAPENSEFCSLCQLAIAGAENLLSQNATETRVLEALESLCNILPASLKSTCLSTISTEGPALIQMIIQKEPASVVCAQLGLCSSSARKPVNAFKRIQFLGIRNKN